LGPPAARAEVAAAAGVAVTPVVATAVAVEVGLTTGVAALAAAGLWQPWQVSLL